jgi:8-oxo-dGTP diphosphatase
MSKPDDVGVGTAIFVLDASNKILLGKRKGAHRAGHWSVPGGWVDREDSDIKVAVIREAYEETGITVKYAEQLCWVTEDHPEIETRTVTLYYITWNGEWSGTPYVAEPNKCEVWEWFDLDDLPSPLFPGMEDAIRLLEQEIVKDQMWD